MMERAKHIRSSFDAALYGLRNDVLMMSSLTDRIFQTAFEALLRRDTELCDHVVAEDEEIDILEKQVDQEGVNLLIRFHPVASDMREVVSAMKVSSHLERIADHSVSIARRAKHLNNRPRPTKEVSVMAWIEDSDQNILLVRQAAGLKLWTLPGGKVKRGESLVKALKREVYEETALHVQIGSLLGVLDRRDKDAITLLFAAIPKYSSAKAKHKQKEIKDVGFQESLPEKASPSAKYFWSARRNPVKKAPKVQASTHQFST